MSRRRSRETTPPDGTQQWPQAEYHQDPLTPDYHGNPLIEALPPILSEDELIESLMYYPSYSKEQRFAPAHARMHYIENSLFFFQPLSAHLDLAGRISCLLRTGYLARNPLGHGFYPNMNKKLGGLQLNSFIKNSLLEQTLGFTMIGVSGVGKTIGLLACLSLYPQVIFHNRYQDQDLNFVQIIWLKINCPHDGSPKGLCLEFFSAIDALIGSNYSEIYGNSRSTVDELLIHMARVTINHGLGLLVVDEIQFLCEANVGGADKMLNFFVRLTTLRVPVILVGTYKAQSILSRKLRQARRGAGQGDFIWDRMIESVEYDEKSADKRIGKDEVGGDWEIFVESLWKYQFLHHHTPLTYKLRHVLYDETQGVTFFTVRAFMLAQWRAISSGLEKINEALIRSVVKDCFRLAKPMLQALKSGNIEDLEDYEDLFPTDFKKLLKTAGDASSHTGAQADAPSTEEAHVSSQGYKDDNPSTSTSQAAMGHQPGRQDSRQKSRNSKKQQVVYAEGDLRKVTSSRKYPDAYAAVREAGYTRSVAAFID